MAAEKELPQEAPKPAARAKQPPKPANEKEYRTWATDVLKINFDEKLKNVTETNLGSALNAVQQSETYTSIPEVLEAAAEEYEGRHPGVRFFAHGGELALLTKSFDSMVEKSFRHNVVWNKEWADKPANTRVAGAKLTPDWTVPSNWYSRFDDLVRGTVVLRYVDGPAFLAERLRKALEAKGVRVAVEPRALDDGYYAYHVYFLVPVTLMTENWEKFTTSLWVEVQLTTQLQEAARSLSHKFYESRRVRPDDGKAWKWNHSTDRFKAAYISHSLHLIDALIVELRDSVEGEEAPAATQEPKAPLEESAKMLLDTTPKKEVPDGSS